MAVTDPEPVVIGSFPYEARHVIRRLRDAFCAIVESLPGRVTRGQEIAQALDIHSKLGWQIASLVHHTDPYTAAEHIPGRASIEKFLDAAAHKRVPPSLITTARVAMDDYERLVEVHAGDRESFGTMLSSYTSESGERVHLARRKAWYAAASYIWGVQADTRVTTHLVHPAARQGWVDLAVLNGLLRFRRMRSGDWVFSTTKRETDDGSNASQPRRESLEPAGDGTDSAGDVPLLRLFSSEPAPKIRRMVTQEGYVMDQIIDGAIGKTAAVDCLTGEVFRSLARPWRTAQDWLWIASARMRTPCRVLVLDHFVHEGLFGGNEPEARMYRNLFDAPRLPIPQRQGDRIPMFESVQYLGQGMHGIRTPDVPRYTEMVQYTLDRLGWDAERFRVHRIRMEYPPVGTTVTMETALPEAPEKEEAVD